MRTQLLLLLLLLAATCQLSAQRTCSYFDYQELELKKDPSLQHKIDEVENLIQRRLAARSGNTAARPQGGYVITIPVVVHILYNQPGENISNEKVFSQIKVLNESFRRLNADTVNTPKAFKAIAADCEIEFKLATSDPQRRSTNGIVRKYTPIALWNADDKMKFSEEMGDDAWDTKNYLNIWVCNLGRVAGYSSFPNGPAAKDGIVIAFSVFGINERPGYDLGRTAVHETGHWLGLRHIWGDSYCGNDMIGDTPKQSNFTPGCPTGIRASCGNGAGGDMYMNYMDLTLDACTNLFTEGQKERIWASFEENGGRHKMLTSYGLLPPMISEIPLEEEPPSWLHPQLYPNPAATEMMLDLSYDIRWVGKMLRISNAQGQLVMLIPVTSKIIKIDITSLRPGFYFISGKKQDGNNIKQKFIKL